jgi:hypothetical protein
MGIDKDAFDQSPALVLLPWWRQWMLNLLWLSVTAAQSCLSVILLPYQVGFCGLGGRFVSQ